MAAGRARRGFNAFLVFAAAAVLLVVAVGWLAGWDTVLAERQNPETEDAYAAGATVAVAPRVEGYLRRLAVSDNQDVRAGQVIAELVDDDYRARVAQAEAQVAAAQAELQQLAGQARILVLQVQQARDQEAATAAEQMRAAEEAARQGALLPTALGLRRTYDNAVADRARLAAQARAQAARTMQLQRQIEVLQAQQSQAQAAVSVRQAAVALARIQLGYTVVRAPVDGTLGTRLVHVGDLLEPGTQIVPLTPLATVWVVANYSERQLTYMRPGQAARVRLDTFPDVELPGHVTGISPLTGSQLSQIPADNTTGNYTKVVQRVPVKIALDPAGNVLAGRVRPGMSALVRVLTDASKPVRPVR